MLANLHGALAHQQRACLSCWLLAWSSSHHATDNISGKSTYIWRGMDGDPLLRSVCIMVVTTDKAGLSCCTTTFPALLILKYFLFLILLNAKFALLHPFTKDTFPVSSVNWHQKKLDSATSSFHCQVLLPPNSPLYMCVLSCDNQVLL